MINLCYFDILEVFDVFFNVIFNVRFNAIFYVFSNFIFNGKNVGGAIIFSQLEGEIFQDTNFLNFSLHQLNNCKWDHNFG